MSARTRTDRKSTRLNSSHVEISYAVFCLKQKTHIVQLAANSASQGVRDTAIPVVAEGPMDTCRARAIYRQRGDGEHLVPLFFFNLPATTESYPLSLHDALPI